MKTVKMFIAWVVFFLFLATIFWFKKYVCMGLGFLVLLGIVNNILGFTYALIISIRQQGFWPVMAKIKIWLHAKYNNIIHKKDVTVINGHRIEYVNKLVYPWRVRIDDKDYLYKPDIDQLMNMDGYPLGKADKILWANK